MGLHRVGLVILLVNLLQTVACQSGNQEYAEIYTQVCSTLEDRFFDPDFGDKDWHEIKRRHGRAIVAATTDEVFYHELNAMLFELDVSHLGVIPSRDAWVGVEPTVFASGSPGLDIRVLDGDAVITAVEHGSPAEMSGLREGWIVRAVDGVSVEVMRRDRLALLEPPYDEPSSVANEILGHVYGPAGTTVRLDVEDVSGESLSLEVRRATRGTPVTYSPDLPAFYESFETRALSAGITLIRFNTFMPGNAEAVIRTIAGLDSRVGSVIDLRGNPGGHRLVAERLAGLFVAEPTVLARVITRDGPRDVVVEPVQPRFDGPVAILVDVMSRSASEAFAAGLQSAGRVRVFGERTTGSLGPAEAIPLSHGATLVCPIGLTISADGQVLEGTGVLPDVEVAWSRGALLEGRDPVIDAAVEYLGRHASARAGD